MKSYISKQVERFLREQKNYKRWLAVFLCLAVIVTIGTAGALKYKGIAVTADNEEVEVHLEEASVSEDMEASSAHVHTDDCYEEREVLICDAAKEEQGHVHDDSCYSVSGGTEELTCDKEEHSHDDSCYTTETVTETVSHTETDEEGNEATVEETVEHEESKLTCDREEHSHGGDCYSVSGGERTLVCGLEEGEGAAGSDHVHDDSCYEIQKVLICGLEEGEEKPEEEVVVPEGFKEGTLTAKGDDYEIIVSYGAEAEIPENAELKVEEIEQESDSYKEYYEQMAEALPANEDGQEMEITFARLFDIVILVDGEEIEPKTEVAVKINYDDVITEDEEQTGYAVHFPDNGEIEIMDADVRGGKEFGFSQSSFSPSGTFFAVPRDGDSNVRIVEIALKKDVYEYPAVSMSSEETIRLRFIIEGGGEVQKIMVSSLDMGLCIGKIIDDRELEVTAASQGITGEVRYDILIMDPEGYEAFIPIKVQDITNKYEVVYEDFEFETAELEELEYGNTKNAENHFVIDQISDGTVTDAGDSEAGVGFPYTTWPVEYKLAKDKTSGDYRYFDFQGWETSTGEKIESGIIGKEEAEKYSVSQEGSDTVKIIKLTPVWEEVKQFQTELVLPKVRFFIALNSEIQETDETSNVPDSSYFTTQVAETTTNGIYEQISIGNQGVKYVPVIYTDVQGSQRRILVAKASNGELQVTAEIDKEIRSLATGVEVTGTNGQNWTYKLAKFPTDEEVLRELRDTDANIKINGNLVKKEDITTDNFTVRWCVFKHDTTDQWHVDGVLVRKQGKLVVAKTFYGDKNAISAVEKDFNITVTEGQSSPAYILKLHDKNAGAPNNDLGYSEKIENGSEVTYIWELGLTADKTFTVKENNYVYNGNKNIATLSEYRISNSNGNQVTEGPWRDYTGAGVQVKTESYASDLPYESFQTVNLRNSYLPQNAITVWKYDKTSNAGLTGVTFNLIKDETIQTVYKNGADYYLYSNDGAVETKVLAVDSNGYLTIHGVEGAKPGKYTLEEVDCPSGYIKKRIGFEIGTDGGVTGTGIKPIGERAYRLDISNESSAVMKIKAVKDWGNTSSEYVESVKVELWRGTEKLEEAVELKEENEWTYNFAKDYPVYVNGVKAEYTLLETAIGDTYRDPGADSVDGYRFYDVAVDGLSYEESDGTGIGTITVRNSVNSGNSLSFTKTDGDGNRLSGAKFALYAKDDSGCNGEALAEAISSGNGEIRFTGLTENIYYMKEVDAPVGYELSEQIYKVTFENNRGKIELYPASETAGETQEDVTAVQSGPITTITNEIAKQTIDIVKVDEKGDPLDNAVFTLVADTLMAQGNYAFEEKDYTSGASGVVAENLELPYGTYTLTETKQPEGYQAVGTITLTVDGTGITANGTDGEYNLEPVGVAGTTPTSYSLKVINVKGSLDGITLTKIGDQNQDTKLGGAVFILGRGTGDQAEYAKINDGIVTGWVKDKTAATRIVTEKETGTAALPSLGIGSYYLTEIEPPEGYVLLTTPVMFNINYLSGEGLRLSIPDGSAKLNTDNKNIIVSNSMGLELPEAGGPGTAAYTFGGLAVIAVGLMYGLSMRRKREKGGLN